MKKIAIALLMCLSIIGADLYAQGINFEHITFEEALVKAKKENKLIFIDFYTVWCAPCKMLAKTVFPDSKVGELFNKEFINLKLDAEKEGREIAKNYKVDAYPTLLFVNGDGDMLYRKVGGINIDQFLAMGHDVIKTANSDYSLLSLQEMFPQKQNDEKFLRIYIDRMIEYGQNPADGIEAWLKIQTEIKENGVDMFEFMLKYVKYMQVDGKAEEILISNYDEFFDIATRQEEGVLKKMQSKMVNNTGTAAYAQKDPQLMRAFINNWKELHGEDANMEALTQYELDYLLFAKDIDAYKAMAEAYMDSIMSAKSLQQIRQEDKAYYEHYKANKYRPSLIANSILNNLEKGREARKQTKIIEKTGFSYLKYCESKKDFKRLHSWIDYGAQLVPGDYNMDNLRASVLNKQGKTKKAIQYKEQALNKLPERDKKRGVIERQLNELKSDQ
ncbi:MULTISPECIES: thioredoxin family protein [unclassified Carboxylicivirga]|uniref:thioredoxin family protein n=1 Tax=Carboxylicivirga TaxID=1628153 RepID=UPI003D327887